MEWKKLEGKRENKGVKGDKRRKRWNGKNLSERGRKEKEEEKRKKREGGRKGKMTCLVSPIFTFWKGSFHAVPLLSAVSPGFHLFRQFLHFQNFQGRVPSQSKNS